MSKTRTIIRYCLVALLLCCAGLTVYLWPYRPVLLVKRDLQKFEMEGIVSLDEEKRLLMTSHMKVGPVQESHLLRYDTSTGECISRSTTEPVSATPFHQLNRSSNGMLMIKYNSSTDTLDVFEADTQRLLKSIPTIVLSMEPHYFDFGFSRNDKYLWSRIGHRIRLYELHTLRLIHEVLLAPQFINLKPKIVYLRDSIDFDISDDGKLLTIADKNLDVVGLIDLTTKKQHTIANANMANILADQRTVLAFKMDEHGVITKQPVYYRLGTLGQLETAPHPQSDSCIGHFLCMNDRFLVTFQQPASVNEPPFFWKWVPQGYHAKVAEVLGMFQFKVPFTVWSTETGEALTRFTLSLPGNLGKNGYTFHRVNAHADVISSDGTLLGLSDTASLSLWNIPPRRHWSCWVVAGSFVLLAVWCGWPRRGKVLAAKPQG